MLEIAKSGLRTLYNRPLQAPWASDFLLDFLKSGSTLHCWVNSPDTDMYLYFVSLHPLFQNQWRDIRSGEEWASWSGRKNYFDKKLFIGSDSTAACNGKFWKSARPAGGNGKLWQTLASSGGNEEQLVLIARQDLQSFFRQSLVMPLALCHHSISTKRISLAKQSNKRSNILEKKFRSCVPIC